MPKSSIRLRRVADLLQREIALIIQGKVADPRLHTVIITAVDVSPDLRQAKVFFTLLDHQQLSSVQKSLKKAIGFIRRELSSQVELRYTPQLYFQWDDSELKAERIVKLINEGLSDEDNTTN